MNMEEVKPCPFCGGKAEIRKPEVQEKYSDEYARAYLMKIICENCKAQISVGFTVSVFLILEQNDWLEKRCKFAKKMLIKLWNERTNKVKPRKVNKNEHC